MDTAYDTLDHVPCRKKHIIYSLKGRRGNINFSFPQESHFNNIKSYENP